jgi:hypothetical protein
MDKPTRDAIRTATQQARKLLDDDFSSQLEGTFDVLRSGVIAPKGGAHLLVRQQFQRDKMVAAIEHKRATGTTAAEAVTDYVRDAAFTTLNRFVALKMLEARQLVQECITKGEQSAGYREFCGMAPGVALLPDAAGYRLYVESLFDEFSTEIKVLFDRRDPASVMWPKRQTFEALLAILNVSDLSGVWSEDETIGWVYQFFNSGEERKKMRDESQAPRNSRELAVRNQFFTPRYVVQFLVDNTLGRLWLEMHDRGGHLLELCEYLVRSTDEPAQPRVRKDPRDLRILDPACGSGHFLLYSFDLLLAIYDEAWSTEGAAPRSDETGRSLQEDYPNFDDLRRAAPRLIVEHNLHGVDIDPRCAQIAALALWLRAQRAWKDLGVAAADRPRIQRTHIVVAEQIPGDAAIVDEFAARLDPPLLRDLFKKMVGETRLAGELGTLLRVEDGIAIELGRAREQFVKQRQATRFLPGMEPVAKQGSLDLSGIDDDQFFHEAEARMFDALRLFAETASGAANVRRRLFAGDAAQGIALIDLVRTHFDVVLMNPPFGAGSIAARSVFEKGYPRTKNDVYAAFVERGVQLLYPRGLLGAITSRTGFFLSRFQKWREEVLLKEAPPVVVADLGLGVMDAALVEAAAYCLEKGRATGYDTTFLRVLEELHDKNAALREAIRNPDAARGRQRFVVDLQSFASVPGAPFAYWVSDRLRDLFKTFPLLESEGRVARRGVNSNDDLRFLRLAWEVCGPDWIPHVKGGVWSPYYADPHMLLKWGDNGKELQAERVTARVYKAAIVPSRELYFRPGLSWARRTKTNLSVRVLPTGCIFGDKGPALFVAGDDHAELQSLLAIANTKVFRSLIEFQLAAADAKAGGAARSYEVGILQRTPIPRLEEATRGELARLAREAWSKKRSLDARTETSHAFVLPALLQAVGHDLQARSGAWKDHIIRLESELAAIETALDERCFVLYGIDEADRLTISDGFGTNISDQESTDNVEEDAGEEGDDDQDTKASEIDAAILGAEVVSWAVGVSFGRFDVRVATGARCSFPTSEIFDQLPAYSPGMLAGNGGAPPLCPPAEYPLAFPESGILVDDPGHAHDLTSGLRAVFEVVFGADAYRWWGDIASALDPKDQDMRTWLASGFFEHHLKRYSKSRRKAPIIWQLGVPSGRYSIWLYAHRLSPDSFFRIQNDVVAPKLAHEERQLANLIQGAGGNPSARERKEIAQQEAFVEELRSVLDEVKRVAPLWSPVLDDGVALTMAPLWRLVPQHKAWQKELKSKWDELATGKYDWSHTAAHLWPERVIPKCASDRSLAISHKLEDVFWVEAEDGKWEPRATPTRQVEELVRERTSVAVKAALRELTDASAPSGGKAKTRRSSS